MPTYTITVTKGDEEFFQSLVSKLGWSIHNDDGTQPMYQFQGIYFSQADLAIWETIRAEIPDEQGIAQIKLYRAKTGYGLKEGHRMWTFFKNVRPEDRYLYRSN